jgi:uncharacterized protein (DUF305 family)
VLAERRRLTRGVASVASALAIVAVAAGCGGNEGPPYDRAFIDAMVPHHEQAIAMAQEAKQAGLVEPELVRIADDVISTQQDEIDRMRAWREEWYGSSEIDPDGADALGLTMEEMGMAHEAGTIAAADDVDAAFAAGMIAHHEGAITMASAALEEAGHEELVELAQAIVQAQTAEVATMRPHADPAMHAGHG